MKTVFAIFSALLLAWAQATAADQTVPAAAPCHCPRACCSAAQSGEQPAAPVAPVSSTQQHPPGNLAAAAVVWVLPATSGPTVSTSFVLPLTIVSAPLYMRDCARLI